jgi:flagellin-like protein
MIMKRGSFKGKRGLSPIIASVLLIMLVIILASLIFFWARGFVTEQIEKFGNNVETMCASVSFSAALVDGSLSGDAFEIVNTGDINIHEIQIKMFRSGNSDTSVFKFRVDAGKAVRGDVSLKMDSGEIPETVTLYPVLLGNVKGKSTNKPFPCWDNQRELVL